MENDDLNDIDNLDDSDTGIEIDKLEVPKSDAVAVPAKPVKTEFEIEPEAPPEKPFKFKLVAALLLTGFAVVLFLLWHLQIISLPFTSKTGNKRASSGSAYHTIAPIITNLDENRRIEISLMIKDHPEAGLRTADIEPVIRDAVLIFLTSADTRKMVNQSDLGKLKPYLKSQITKRLLADYSDLIVLKDIKIY